MNSQEGAIELKLAFMQHFSSQPEPPPPKKFQYISDSYHSSGFRQHNRLTLHYPAGHSSQWTAGTIKIQSKCLLKTIHAKNPQNHGREIDPCALRWGPVSTHLPTNSVEAKPPEGHRWEVQRFIFLSINYLRVFTSSLLIAGWCGLLLYFPRCMLAMFRVPIR